MCTTLAKHETALAVAIIKRYGGYREHAIIKAPHTVERGETWSDDHRVVYVTEKQEGPDGYRNGCAVDLVTRSIVG